MTEAFTCIRCRRDDVSSLQTAPIPGPLGEEVLARICASCWSEWQGMEVMVINELRLNFMDPKAQAILDQHLREFLCLDGGTPPPPFAPPDL